MFISVQLIDHNYSTTINLPVVNHGELRERISYFIQKRGRKCPEAMLHSHLCKKLFQNSHCELAAFPKVRLDKTSISCGDLLVCALSPEKGVVLCFIPLTTIPSIRPAKMTEQFQGKNYPNCSEASMCLFSRTEISFLVCEEGMINIGTNDPCTLQGLEIYLLRYKNTNQTLFCQKSTSNLLIQSPCLMGEVSSDYILVDCLCKEKNFCFQIGVPVFSQKEVDVKICSARKSRATSLKLNCLSKNTYLRFIKIFPQGASKHHIACFPNQMLLSLPFGLIEGGQLLFSQEKNNGIMKCTIISNLFVSGEKRHVRNASIFPNWQIEDPSYTQTNLSTNNIICFSDSSVTIARKGNSQELFILGAQVKLICSPRGIWGVYFFKQGVLFSGLQSEETTLIPCFVMRQVFFHSEQSRSNCDTEKDSSQGAKKRSAACLGLNFADQDPLCSSVHVPKKGNFKEIKSSTQVVLLSPDPLNDPNQRPLARLTASMVKLPVDAVSLQSAPLQLPDVPSFTLKKSQKTTSDSNPFGLGAGAEAFQGTMSPFITTSSRFFQQDPSSITPSESTSITSSLEISSISQEATQLNENAWKAITKEDSSHGAKKRSAACLGLNFADQDPLCSSVHVPKKGNFKEIKSSTQVVLLSPDPLNDPNQRPLARLTASMVKLPVDAVSLQSAPLQLPDVPSFTLKKSQKTTSDSNPFGLGAGAEAFQGTMSPLITTSSRFFQQDPSSITPSESTSITSSLEISSISQEATQLNENAWKAITKEDSSHGAKKRSSTCLGLNFADQDPLCSSVHVPKKGNFKRIKSSTQIVLLSAGPLDDLNQRPLARLTASMVKLPVDAVPLQSESLQLPDLPSFTLKESQKTTSDSNSFGLDAEAEAFQGMMSPLITSSSRFFQQDISSITSSESTSTISSLGISSISQEATQLNENAWKTILDIINTNHSSTRPSERISTTTSSEISSFSQESKQSNKEIWEDLCAIVDAVPLQSESLQLPDLPSFTLKESQKTTSDSNSFGLDAEAEAFQGMMSPLITSSSRFFQQDISSITSSESTSTISSLGISSISQEATQLNENAWKTILDIINTNHSSTRPSERISTTTSSEISSFSQESKQSNKEIWEDLCAIVDAVPLQSESLQLPDLPSFTLKESQKTTSDSNSFGLDAEAEAFQGMMSPLITSSSRFFQQDISSITSSESTSTISSLGISSISQEATQLNENAWKTILDIINTNHSSTRPSERISTTTSLEISSVSQESKQSNEETWKDLFAIIER